VTHLMGTGGHGVAYDGYGFRDDGDGFGGDGDGFQCLYPCRPLVRTEPALDVNVMHMHVSVTQYKVNDAYCTFCEFCDQKRSVTF